LVRRSVGWTRATIWGVVIWSAARAQFFGTGVGNAQKTYDDQNGSQYVEYFIPSTLMSQQDYAFYHDSES